MTRLGDAVHVVHELEMFLVFFNAGEYLSSSNVVVGSDLISNLHVLTLPKHGTAKSRVEITVNIAYNLCSTVGKEHSSRRTHRLVS